jgi:myo-inositol 2-dehydrogenase / D-chiro-inositol 1-dehydrogenase
MAADQEDSTEITGTEGKPSINTQPISNPVSIYDPSGIRREIPAHYYARFWEAFVTGTNEFMACCLDNTELPMRLRGAVNTVKVGCALKESLITGKEIECDEIGRLITPTDELLEAKLW